MALIDEIQQRARRQAGLSGGNVNLEDTLGGLIRSPFEQDPSTVAGLETLEGATDITGELGRARGRFEENILPQILARLSAAGLGRGGAAGDAVSRGFASLAAPIEARGAQATQNFGQAQLNVGSNQQNSLRNAIAQLLGLRTNQANINSRFAGSNTQRPSSFLRSFNSPASSVSGDFRGPGTNSTATPSRTPLTDAQVKAQQQATSSLAQSRLAKFPTGASFFAPSQPRKPFLSNSPFESRGIVA